MLSQNVASLANEKTKSDVLLRLSAHISAPSRVLCVMSVRPTHQAICSVFTPWHHNPSLSWVTPQNSNPNGPLCYEKNIAFLYFSYLHGNISERAAEIKAGDRETYSKRERERCHWLLVPVALFLPCSAAQGWQAPKQCPLYACERAHTGTHGHTRTYTCTLCLACQPRQHLSTADHFIGHPQREKVNERKKWATTNTAGKANDWPRCPDGSCPIWRIQRKLSHDTKRRGFAVSFILWS